MISMPAAAARAKAVRTYRSTAARSTAAPVSLSAPGRKTLATGTGNGKSRSAVSCAATASSGNSGCKSRTTFTSM